jgi:hypothetical protein
MRYHLLWPGHQKKQIVPIFFTGFSQKNPMDKKQSSNPSESNDLGLAAAGSTDSLPNFSICAAKFFSAWSATFKARLK